MCAQVAGPTRWRQVSQVFTRAHVIVFELVKGAAVLVRRLVLRLTKIRDKIRLQFSINALIYRCDGASVISRFIPNYAFFYYDSSWARVESYDKCSHLSFISVKKNANIIICSLKLSA